MQPSEQHAVRLCDFLDDHQEQILSLWEEALRTSPGAQPLSSSVLRDHVPDLLRRIADVVRTVHDPHPVTLGDLPDLHALDRLEEGLELRSAASELALLRDIALELWEPHAAGFDAAIVLKEVRRFNQAVDEVVARSVDRFARARDRILASLDQVSAAALGTGDLDTFLPRLLDVLLKTTEAAAMALVYLVEGDALRVRAAAGLGAEAALGFALRVGEGVAGRVAETREPLLVHDAGRDPLVTAPGVKGGPVRALYAVPLLHDSNLVGVAFMGSASAYDFSADDKQLFRAMAQRATSIIVQAQLLGREREALAALRRGEEELRRVMEISPDIIAVVAADGYMRRVNPAFSVVLGYSEAELLALPYAELVYPEDREKVAAEVRAVFGGTPARRFTFRVLRKDGTVRWVAFNASAEPGTDLLVAVGRDVTEERERSDWEQQLIGIVSHDLRNPLNTILMSSTALIARPDDLDERTFKAVGRIHSAAARASELIRNLLDFTKARTTGGIAIAPQRLDVHVLARAVAEEVQASYADRSLVVEAEGDGAGRWDPARIAQVVENLVSNAFKYGSPDAPVVVRTLGGDRWIRLEVHNAGNPIDPALLPHVFEPLRQGRRTGSVGGATGVGLGLYIVEHIVRAHGGNIDVRSTDAEGTTFAVRLPREPPAQR